MLISDTGPGRETEIERVSLASLLDLIMMRWIGYGPRKKKHGYDGYGR